MQEAIRNYCLQHRIYSDHEPSLLPYSSRSWLIKDVTGQVWICKSTSRQDNTVEILKGFSVLHPPFRYPRPISQAGDPFMLYPYMDGRNLADDGLFEASEILTQAMETVGRMQAALRSLVLVPSYQETLKYGKESGVSVDQLTEGRDLGRIQSMDDRQKMARQLEISESFHWTNGRAGDCAATLLEAKLWTKADFNPYLESLKNYFPLHVPVVGSSLCHGAFHPEHLLICSGNVFGIVGWQVAARPRFYMQHTYLTWSFLHSTKTDAKEFYWNRLKEMSSRVFHKEHHLVFAFCLLEQTASLVVGSPDARKGCSEERIMEAQDLFMACFETLTPV